MPHVGRRVWAVRHAATESSGICVGDGDVPCMIPAEEAAASIMALLGDSAVICVWSSPRERCLGPARRVAQRLGVSLRVDERLREICLGQWQLKSWEAIDAANPEGFRAWMTNWLTQAPPGGEVPAQVQERVEAWWQGLPGGAHLLVAHAGVMRALHVLVNGMSWAEAMRADIPHLGGECFFRGER